jgi:hypothetical protein
MEEEDRESVENETIIYELSAKIPLLGFELSASSISLCSMPLALCKTLYDLRLALYTLRLNNNAMRFALCPLRSFVSMANFFMDDLLK